jgi:hypothetical protein
MTSCNHARPTLEGFVAAAVAESAYRLNVPRLFAALLLLACRDCHPCAAGANFVSGLAALA